MQQDILGAKMICQIGLVVHDVLETGRAWADFFGVECPPVRHSGEYEATKAEYKGQPSRATCRMMFFEFENIQIELIQPDKTPSVWRDDLEKYGEGVHHIAFQVKDSRGKEAALAARGFPTLQAGDYSDNSGRYSYIGTKDALKLVVELLESY